MAKIDIITLSAITASDGSIIESGATLKFDTKFQAASTIVEATPKIYRNRELFDAGYSNIPVPYETIPHEIKLILGEEEFYTLTPVLLYHKVCEYLNIYFNETMFEVIIIQ